jgi:hypothetical protein
MPGTSNGTVLAERQAKRHDTRQDPGGEKGRDTSYSG